MKLGRIHYSVDVPHMARESRGESVDGRNFWERCFPAGEQGCMILGRKIWNSHFPSELSKIIIERNHELRYVNSC